MFLAQLVSEGKSYRAIYTLCVCVFLCIDSNEDEFRKNVQDLLPKLPDVHYSVLRYLCRFLTQVEKQQCHNRMTAFNLATVFGPNVFQ